MKVGCYDPTNELTPHRMGFRSGQNLSFPTENGFSYIIQCSSGYVWLDSSSFKSLQCENQKWSSLPSPCMSIEVSILKILANCFPKLLK